jgi:hypothetical protein
MIVGGKLELRLSPSRLIGHSFTCHASKNELANAAQVPGVAAALSEQNSKYLERPLNRSDRPGKLQENQWPRNPVLTFWQSKQICSDNAPVLLINLL